MVGKSRRAYKNAGMILKDDPTKGYGIFADNMLETAQGVGQGLAPADKLKVAS